MKEFDYYIFIDYSVDFIGYIIIERSKIKELSSKISKLKHYKEVNNKNQYLRAIKSSFEKNRLNDLLFSLKIKKMVHTLEIYADITDFISSHRDCSIFISLDDNQSSNFERLVKDIDGEKILIIKEGKLKKDSIEHKLSLLIDNLLNIDRRNGEKLW